MTLEGKLERLSFGGGAWVLRGEGHPPYQLFGSIPPELKRRRVRVSGKKSPSSFSLSMTGIPFDVEKIELAER